MRRVLIMTRKYPLGMFGLGLLFLLTVVAVFAPLFAPYDP